MEATLTNGSTDTCTHNCSGGYRCPDLPDPLSHEALEPAASLILSHCPPDTQPTIGIICGSGLGGVGDLVENPTVIPYGDIPGFSSSSAPGHKGVLIVGRMNSASVVIMQGRLHSYEGHPLWRATLPIRVMKLLGVRNLIVTNAVGAVNQSYQVGDIMLVRDHINLFGLSGESPLRGPNDRQFGPRFFAVNDLYDEKWRSLAKEAAREVKLTGAVREGVLTITGGPNFESVAELKMLSSLGADCVGMSSIPESLVGHHCGIGILAFSLITNLCKMDYSPSNLPNAQEVLDVAASKNQEMKLFVQNLVQKIHNNQNTT